MSSVLLLGRDHATYGEATVIQVTAKLSAAISVGADPSSPSMRFKADLEAPNEDALTAVQEGDLTLIAVADAHFGPESSHVLVEGIHQRATDGFPRAPQNLATLMDGLDSEPLTESETALLVAVHDRSTGRGFGLSVGDTSLWVVGSRTAPVRINPHNRWYTTTWWDPGLAEAFAFRTEPGDTVLAFTDGVDECHYRQPDTSVRPGHLAEIVGQNPGRPTIIAEQLVEMALNGVDGNPGGQDNIALAVLQA